MRKEMIFTDERVQRAAALLKERGLLGRSLKNLEAAAQKLSKSDEEDVELWELYGRICSHARTVRTYIEHVDSAVDSLDSYYARLVRLAYYDGLTAGEICERYGWSSINSYYYHRRLALLTLFTIWFGKEVAEGEKEEGAEGAYRRSS